MRTKIIFLFLGIFCLVVLTGCKSTPDNLNSPKEISTAEIPQEIPQKCIEFKNDICELFSCMVDICWCDDLSPSGGILMEGRRKILTEEDAKEEVRRHLTGFYNHEPGVLFGKMRSVKVNNAVKLNNVFFNVFAEVDREGYEEVYTVANNGTIIKTICGI